MKKIDAIVARDAHWRTNLIIPNKLLRGDEIRVIAPSRSLGIISKTNRTYADHFFRKHGFKLSFGKNIEECDLFKSSSIASRLSDLHEAFADPSIFAKLTFHREKFLMPVFCSIATKTPASSGAELSSIVTFSFMQITEEMRNL